MGQVVDLAAARSARYAKRLEDPDFIIYLKQVVNNLGPFLGLTVSRTADLVWPHYKNGVPPAAAANRVVEEFWRT